MESKSRLSRANPGLSIQEYVDKTIYDALEMFGSGEVPPCSRVARSLIIGTAHFGLHAGHSQETTDFYRPPGTAFMQHSNYYRAFLWIASTTDACRPVARPAPQCDSAARSQWSDDFLMCS